MASQRQGRFEAILVNAPSWCHLFVNLLYIASEALEGEKILQVANMTRWNSQLKMIRSVLSISPEKFHSLDCFLVLSAHEKNILRDIMEILLPFEEATDAVQVDLEEYLLEPCTEQTDDPLKYWKKLSKHISNTSCYSKACPECSSIFCTC